MSIFTKIFGGKKEDSTHTPQEALQKVHGSEDMLIKKQEHLAAKIESVSFQLYASTYPINYAILSAQMHFSHPIDF